MDMLNELFMTAEKPLLWFFVLVVATDMVGKFSYEHRYKDGCAITLGRIMDTVGIISVPVLGVLDVILLDVKWWIPIAICVLGLIVAAIIRLLPIIDIIVCMVCYIAMPTSLVMCIVELCH